MVLRTGWDLRASLLDPVTPAKNTPSSSLRWEHKVSLLSSVCKALHSLGFLPQTLLLSKKPPVLVKLLFSSSLLCVNRPFPT